MIFLPGYDEICTAKKAIEERGADILEFNKLLIFTLHSKIKVIIVIFNCKYSITKVQVRIKKLTDIIIEWTEIYVMNYVFKNNYTNFNNEIISNRPIDDLLKSVL